MKEQYLKWITAWMSKDFKPKMREGVKNLYTPAANESEDYIWVSWGLDDPKDETLIQKITEEETLSLIEVAIDHGWQFGDVEVELEDIPVYGAADDKTFPHIKLSLPVVE